MKVTVNGRITEYAEDATFEEVAQAHQEEYGNEIALVIANGKIQELHKKIREDCEVSFLTLRDAIGHRAYVRTVKMMFLKAITDVVGRDTLERVKVEFAVSNGYYCTVKGDLQATEELAEAVQKRMMELSEERLPITKKYYPMGKCMKLIRKHGMRDKERLFRYRRSSGVNLYCLDGFYDYYYGYMLQDTGYAKYFQVIAYGEGFMLVMPDEKAPFKLKPFCPQEKLFATLKAATGWSVQVGIENVGELNDVICGNHMQEMILWQEAEQERRIGEIAKEVTGRSHVKFVMIAGPSSSGKTSFANRLSVQLRALGKIPHLISLDDYFVNREDTPLDEKGDYNFECLGAIDVELFNRDMLKLLGGEEVELPSFNFKTGHREYNGHVMKLNEEDILVIEGIHGLNPELTASLPASSTFKVYVSALTTLHIDDHNWISTTDNRLLRRIVRDYKYRHTSALESIRRWPSVRRGEEKWIFPFQENADATFNSSLIFELGVMKRFAEPLLRDVPHDTVQYADAHRLLRLLSYFEPIEESQVPSTSLLREFLGGSSFKY